MKSIAEIHEIFLNTTGICRDTRNIIKDSLFIALKGENFNGNNFAEQALNDGCKYALIDEKEFAIDDRFILVDDVLKSLQNLANFHRKQFDIPVIGITGSNGKTTTKELMAATLEPKYNILYTIGNLNNHIGVPLTLLRITSEHEIAIIEMGANKPGDIKELVEIAEPNYGLITNIGKAHIQGFGNVEGVIQTKKELYDFLGKKDGKLFLNAEDDILVNIAPKNCLCITYGEEKGYVKGELQELTPMVRFSWNTEDYLSPILNTQLIGKYNFLNFLAAITVAYYFEVDNKLINTAIENYTPTNNRSQVEKTEKNTVIVDCYNANPTSMISALESFVAIQQPNKIAILGDMLELGEISKDEHLKIVNWLNDHHIHAYLVGDEFLNVNDGITAFKNVDELNNHLKNTPIKDSLVLLKGSRGIKLENCLELL